MLKLVTATQPTSSRALCLLVVASTVWGLLSPPAAADSPPGKALSQASNQAIEELERFEGTTRSRDNLLRRNMGRYFARYILPNEGDPLARLLGSLERTSLGFGEQLLIASATAARARNSSTIDIQDVAAVAASTIPRALDPTIEGTVLFFPEKGASALRVERVDLEAMRGTSLPWGLVLSIASGQTASSLSDLQMSDRAARGYAQAISDFSLLLLRLGGLHAARDLAPELAARHLRAAARTIAEGGPSLDLLTAPVPERQGTGMFVDVTAESGVDFRHESSPWISRFRRFGIVAPSFSGGGVSAVDLDNDGWDDLVLCGGKGCRLWLNLGDGRFEERTDSSGISIIDEARMPVVADFDNDGKRDLFVTYARSSNRIFRNVSEGDSLTFVDVTLNSGLDLTGFISGPAVVFDFNNDGLLDVFVGNFGNYMEGASPWIPDSVAQPNQLFKNLGGFRFEDVSEASGVADKGWAQAASHADFDLDGDQDIYVANDFGINALLFNQGDGTFESGAAGAGADDPNHGMNVAFADLNGDRYPEVFISNIWAWEAVSRKPTETNTLLMSTVEPGNKVSWTPSTHPSLTEIDSGWSWAALWFDLENDGDLDLLNLNGFTEYYTFALWRPHPEDPNALVPINNDGDSNLLFVNDGEQIASRVVKSGLELPGHNGRALALADFDHDGDLDPVLTNFHEKAYLFRNDSPPGNHWLSVELRGSAGAGTPGGVNRDAIGTVVIARGDGGFYAWRMVNGGEGYLAMSSLPIEIGLGKHLQVDLEVIWPDGSRQTFTAVAADRRIRITHGTDSIIDLAESGS